MTWFSRAAHGEQTTYLMRSTQSSRFSLNVSSLWGGLATFEEESEWLGGTGGGGINDETGGGMVGGCGASDLTPFACVRDTIFIGWKRPSNRPVVATGVTGVDGD